MLRAIWEFMQTLAWWHLGTLCALVPVFIVLIVLLTLWIVGYEKLEKWLNKKP